VDLLTTTSAAAIDTLEAECVHSQVGKAFIYCNYAERSEQSIEQLLGSLIQQLLRQCKIPDHISQFYNKSSGKRPDANELASHLQQVIAKFSTVYIVIDALDECEDVNKTRSTLLSHMKSLPSQVRIMFTSRPLGEVDTLQTAKKFEVMAQAEDIHKYIVAQMARESHLVELCAKDAALERDIVDQISQKAGGM
jgi:ankyrin repeat domain-containing protein 50